MSPHLPPGQRATSAFPRFGVPVFGRYRGADVSGIQVGGDLPEPFEIRPDEIARLERIELEADLHCVTTWSRCGLRWSGFLFRDLYDEFLKPSTPLTVDLQWMVFKGADGYRATLFLEDALRSDVILADRLNGKKLPFEHGAPLRLIAPAHYGYKSVKHVFGVDLRCEFRPAGLLEHTRARVDLEERGRVLPGRLLRYIYRPMIRPTAWWFRRAERKQA